MTGLFWAVAAAALALDVGSKLWAVRSLEQAVTVLPGILELRLSRNNGMALGLLSGNWLANLLLPLAVIVAGWLLMRRYCPTVFTRVAAGLIVGGFLGNLAKDFCSAVWWICCIFRGCRGLSATGRTLPSALAWRCW